MNSLSWEKISVSSNPSSLYAIQKEMHSLESIIGNSPPIRKLKEYIRRIIEIPSTTIFIRGDSGTGKELVAKCIHYNSCKKGEPFIESNSSAIPETLLESELFGHERGAFTDAKTRKKGLLELADGGTLFLDEIGNMQLGLQAKLLKVIEDKTFRRLGGAETISVSVRVIAATNVDIEASMEKGDFREDLYYRLNVIPIVLPSLRERGNDVALITNHFIDEFNREYDKNIMGLSPQAEEKLLKYDWPGNIRELKNVLLRAVLLESDEIILPEHLMLDPRRGRRTKIDDSSVVRMDKNGEIDVDLPSNGISLEKVEVELIKATLAKTNWNISQSARLLDLTRDTLRYRIEKYELQDMRKN